MLLLTTILLQSARAECGYNFVLSNFSRIHPHILHSAVVSNESTHTQRAERSQSPPNAIAIHEDVIERNIKYFSCSSDIFLLYLFTIIHVFVGFSWFDWEKKIIGSTQTCRLPAHKQQACRAMPSMWIQRWSFEVLLLRVTYISFVLSRR